MSLPPLPCRPEDVPTGLSGDVTRCKVCGDVLRLRDPASGEYVGAPAHFGIRVPDETTMAEVPRRGPGESVEQYLDRKLNAGTLWALCDTDAARALA